MVHRRSVRFTAGVLSLLLLAPLMGCQQRTSSQPGREPASAPTGPTRQGMSTRNKVLLLAGAAALYYLYNKHKNRQGQGAEGRYYLSKNGRVYYRDLKTGDYRWVDPPKEPIQVPAEEYERYTGRTATADEGEVIRQAPAGWPPSSPPGPARSTP